MGERVRIGAYVVRAGAPDDGLNLARRAVHVVYRDASGRLQRAHDRLRIPKERWIVPGMTVPALLDPERPDRVAVQLEEIPPLEQRIAADAWPLCDLERVRRELRELKFELEGQLVEESGAEDMALDMRDEIVAGHLSDAAARDERAAAERPQAPVIGPDGRLRGTADLVAATARPTGSTTEGQPTVWRGHRLIRVWLYGHAPYPLVDTVWMDVNRPRTRLAHGAVPVSVSPLDRTDVQYLWDEYDRDGRRVLRERIAQDIEQSLRDAGRAQALGIEASLEAITDLEQRRQVAEQLRRMGHEVPDHLLRDRERLAKLDALLARGVISRAEYDEQAARC